MTEVEFLREMVSALTKQNSELQAKIAVPERIDELLEQLDKKNKNSRNSSKPPSSEGYSKPAPKSLKKPSGKKPGGQTGHKGSSMKPLRAPDEVKEHYPSACIGCPNRALCQMRVAERRYEEDMVVRTRIVEHRQMACCCPKQRNETVKGNFPANITATKQYGNNLRQHRTTRKN